MMFGKAPRQQRQNSEDCKIKIKNTADGKTISFSGNCSKDQIDIARSMNLDAQEVESEED